MKYRKKPVVIDAIQWDGTYESKQKIIAMFPEMYVCSCGENPLYKYVTHWSISTLEGSHKVSVDDYIIKGVAGEFYPCKPDIFAETYEKVET